MSDTLWNNLLTYALQLALLVGAAGWIPAAARLRPARARLAFFQALLAADPDVRKYLSTAEIAANFDLAYHLKEVDTIFARVFGVS